MSNLGEAWNQYYKQQLEESSLKSKLEQNSPEEE